MLSGWLADADVVDWTEPEGVATSTEPLNSGMMVPESLPFWAVNVRGVR